MGYKSKEKQRRYQRTWMQRRRAAWLDANGPCVDCGSTEDLEVDHVDPTEKECHRVWSWSEERREEELSKCVVRCHECHKQRTWIQTRGEKNHFAKLTRRQVVQIHALYGAGRTQLEIANLFGVSRTDVYQIVNGNRWTHVFDDLFPNGRNARGVLRRAA